jgi:hypothetical protein
VDVGEDGYLHRVIITDLPKRPVDSSVLNNILPDQAIDILLKFFVIACDCKVFHDCLSYQ